MAFNTGNPVPSNNAKDLSDNAENLDSAVNSSAATWNDRLGVVRKTVEGATNSIDVASTQGLIDIAADVSTVDSLAAQATIDINADADAFDALALQRLNEIGVIYDSPIRNWSASLLVDDLRAHRYPANTGDIYIPTKALPFTTGSTFNAADWELFQGVTPADIINDTAQDIVFPTVAAFKASLDLLPDGKRVYLADRDAYFTKISGTGTANTFTIIASTSLSQSIALSAVGAIDLRWVGAVPNQDVTPLVSFLDGDGGGIFTYKSSEGELPLKINNHTFVNKIHLTCEGTEPHFAPINSTGVVFKFSAVNSFIKATFDYSQAVTDFWTPVGLFANNCKSDIIVLNLQAPAGNADATVSACKVAANFCNVVLDGRSITNTGNVNGSLPHLVDVDGGSSNTIITAECNVGVAGVVTNNATSTIVKSLVLRGMTDNGVYTLDNSKCLTVNYMYYQGEEEPVVDKGSETLIDELVIENQLFPIGIDNNTSPLTINSLNLIVTNVDIVKAARSSIMQTRSGNTTSAGVNIGRITGKTYGDRLFGLSTGTVTDVKIRNIDVTHIYHNAAQSKAIYTQTLGSKFTFEGWNLVIEDQTGSLGSSDHFTFAAPSTVTGYSVWKNMIVTCPSGDYDFRGQNLIQNNILIEDATLQILGSNIYVREVPYNNVGRKIVYYSGIPAAGSWKDGDIIKDPTPTAGAAVEWVATADIADASVDNSAFKVTKTAAL